MNRETPELRALTLNQTVQLPLTVLRPLELKHFNFRLGGQRERHDGRLPLAATSSGRDAGRAQADAPVPHEPCQEPEIPGSKSLFVIDI